MPALPRLTSALAIFVALLLVIFAVSNIPDLHAEDESRAAAAGKKPASSPRVGNRPGSPSFWRRSAGCCISLLPRFSDWCGPCCT